MAQLDVTDFGTTPFRIFGAHNCDDGASGIIFGLDVEPPLKVTHTFTPDPDQGPDLHAYLKVSADLNPGTGKPVEWIDIRGTTKSGGDSQWQIHAAWILDNDERHHLPIRRIIDAGFSTVGAKLETTFVLPRITHTVAGKPISDFADTATVHVVMGTELLFDDPTTFVGSGEAELSLLELTSVSLPDAQEPGVVFTSSGFTVLPNIAAEAVAQHPDVIGGHTGDLVMAMSMAVTDADGFAHFARYKVPDRHEFRLGMIDDTDRVGILPAGVYNVNLKAHYRAFAGKPHVWEVDRGFTIVEAGEPSALHATVTDDGRAVSVTVFREDEVIATRKRVDRSAVADPGPGDWLTVFGGQTGDEVGVAVTRID